MERGPIVASSARKHGVTDDDALHAQRNAIRAFDVDEGLTMYVGPDVSGQLLEIGAVEGSDGVVIVHAMPARRRFL